MKVISFSLFGDDPAYQNGAIANLKLCREIYPDWQCRFFVSQEVPAEIVDQLSSDGEVVSMTRTDVADGTFWRFLPVSDPDLEICLIRDLDARVTSREKRVVDHWLDSGKACHIIRDRPWHCFPMMAGLWGVRGQAIPQIGDLIAAWPDFSTWGADQTFLADIIYPLIKDDVLIHTDFVIYEGETVQPMPIPRVDNDYMGRPVGRGKITRERVDAFDRHGKKGLRVCQFPAPYSKEPTD